MKLLSKSIHSFLLILLMGILGIVSSIAASEPVTAVECFAYDGQYQATIGYDGGLPPAFAYDSAATLTAEREANQRAGAGTFFDKVAKFLAADTGSQTFQILNGVRRATAADVTAANVGK